MFRKNVLVVCFLSLLVAIANSQINYNTLDFKVEITNPKVKIGEKLAVEITVKNISDQNIWFNKKGIYFIEKLKKGSVVKPELTFSGTKTELANEKDFVLLDKGDSFTKTLFFPLQEKMKIDGKEQKVPLVLQDVIPTGDQKPKIASYKMEAGVYEIQFSYDNSQEFIQSSTDKTFKGRLLGDLITFTLIY